MAQKLYATFRNMADAESAVSSLLEHGAHKHDLTLVVQRLDIADVDKDVETVKELELAGVRRAESDQIGATSSHGVGTGVGIGIGVGLIAGLAALAVPGVGMIYGAGALAATAGALLATSTAGGIAGGLAVYLKEQGMSEALTSMYADAIHNGATLLELAIPSGDVDSITAVDIAHKYDGENIDIF